MSARFGQVLPAPQKGSQGGGGPPWSAGVGERKGLRLHPIISPVSASEGLSVHLSACLMRDVRMPHEWDRHLTEPPGQT